MEPAVKRRKKEDEVTAGKLQSLKETVFKAAMEGNTEEIKAILSGLPEENVKEVLHRHHLFRGILHSPLTVAISFGKACMVRFLVEEFRVDIEQSATLDSFGQRLETALITAVQTRQLDIAKILVQNGADVNEMSGHSRTTPLHEACYVGDVEMVKFLVDKGARTDVLDELNRTCLMEACRPGNEDTVQFLLEKGMDPNQSSDGRTALFYAAFSDTGEVGEMLIAHGAVMTKDSDGYTPLTLAITYDNSNFVDVVLYSPLIPREEKIRGLELRAAFCYLEHTDDAIQYLKEAMTERHRDPSCVLLKPHRPPEPALGNVSESQTMEELLARERDPTALAFECLLIVERILGPDDTHTTSLCMMVCHYLGSRNRMSEAIALWLYSRRVARLDMRSNFVDTHILDIFEDARRKGFPVVFAEWIPVLTVVLEGGEEMVNLSPKDDNFELHAYSQAQLTLSLFKDALDISQSHEHESQLQDLMRRFQIVLPSLVPQSLVHSVIEFLYYNYHYMSEQTRASWVRFVDFLLKCGCDPDAEDENRNAPLHNIATSRMFEESLEVVLQITRLLLEAGAHVDIHNNQGKTPLDDARSPEVQSILREYYPLSLKCLAASAVIEHGISYDDRVPTSVKNFIKLHSPGRQ